MRKIHDRTIIENKKIDEIKQKIVNSPVEWAHVIDLNGNEVVNSRKGSETKVFFNEEHKAKFAGCIYLHNHPKAGSSDDKKTNHYSISRPDVLLAFCRELNEMRAVDSKYRYSLSTIYDKFAN